LAVWPAATLNSPLLQFPPSGVLLNAAEICPVLPVMAFASLFASSVDWPFIPVMRNSTAARWSAGFRSCRGPSRG
jgi:hypothetical protein